MPELKERLRGLGLKRSGLKKELQIRLKHYTDNPDLIAADSRGPVADERAAAKEVAHQNEILEDVCQEEAEGVRTQEECFQHETEEDIVMEQILQGGEMI